MGHRSNISHQARGFYYAASGENILDGRSLEAPKKTIQAALDGALTLTPPPSTSATAFVREAQGGLYFEDLTLYDSVLFDGSQTTIVSAGAVGVSAANFVSFRPQTLVNNTTGASCLEVDGVESFGINMAAMFIGGDSGVGFDVKGACDNLFFSVNQVELRGDGCTGVEVTASSNTPMDFNFNTCSFQYSNATFFVFNPPGGDDTADLNISSLADPGGVSPSFLGTTGIVVNEGRLKVRAGSLQAETVLNVGAGGVLSVSADAVVGAITSAGGAVLDTVGIIAGNLDTTGAGTLHVRSSLITGGATTAGTGAMCLKCDIFIGDITVGVGTTMFAIIDKHTGTLTINGTLNGIINGIRYGNWQNRRKMDTLLSADSFVDQNPVALDTPLQISFGAAQPGAIVDLDASGVMEIGEDGQYEFSFTFQYGRSGSGGIAWIFFRLLVNGTQVGTSPFAKLENVNADFPSEFNNTLDLIDGDLVTVELVRDSRGNNSGGLLMETPLVGWNPSPSASVSVKRSKLQ
jgi:hypothetical protein